MKRTTIMILILISLFMFQIFWNVAAAFCSHESNTRSVAHHFGHHLNFDAKTQHPQNSVVQTELSAPLDSLLQDHHEHLQGCLHVVTPSIQQQTQEPLRSARLIQQDYSWSNSYQSPHLFKPNPPPVLTPLLVG